MANSVALEIEGCREKEPLQNARLSFPVVAVVAPFRRGGLKQINCLRGGVRGIIGGNRGCRGKRGKKGGKIGIP